MVSASPAPLSVHVPVMVREVLRELELAAGLTVVDGTVGGGGHSRKILEALGPSGRLLGLDRDPEMLDRARGSLTFDNVRLVHGSYADLDAVLADIAWPPVDRILVDLGLSSDQLAADHRGFSFHAQGMLDLRFDTQQGEPAWQWLQRMSETELAALFIDYGEEPHAKTIAAAIVRQRATQPIRTATELAKLIEQVVKSPQRDRHPATRVFQALRIAVNRELEQLTKALDVTFPRCLVPGGLLAVITFHSLEDRLVKDAFRRSDVWENRTPKPIEPSPTEVRVNPRSRSAKLRIARRQP
ncbi:MAG: 16S rRNA (cytosine(1402)-N(4))-methyltransferase RsmH [Planctomycetaceae bacterium]|nr:16S rRNA (cytosine(1402)-N(4))-methyltransferase RsmH [Planctomycetaceae bacterium]